jgi:hypothetical protein
MDVEVCAEIWSRDMLRSRELKCRNETFKKQPKKFDIMNGTKDQKLDIASLARETWVCFKDSPVPTRSTSGSVYQHISVSNPDLCFGKLPNLTDGERKHEMHMCD